jgi:hypothetical protein
MLRGMAGEFFKRNWDLREIEWVRNASIERPDEPEMEPEMNVDYQYTGRTTQIRGRRLP